MVCSPSISLGVNFFSGACLSTVASSFANCVCLLTSKLPHQSWYKIEVYPIPYVNRTVEKNNSKETYDWVAMK